MELVKIDLVWFNPDMVESVYEHKDKSRGGQCCIDCGGTDQYYVNTPIEEVISLLTSPTLKDEGSQSPVPGQGSAGAGEGENKQ